MMYTNVKGYQIPNLSLPKAKKTNLNRYGRIYDTINGVNCFIILTTAPNDSVAPIHDRMPLLLSHEQVRPWLVDAGAALELLCSRPPLLLRTSCDGQLGFDDLA